MTLEFFFQNFFFSETMPTTTTSALPLLGECKGGEGGVHRNSKRIFLQKRKSPPIVKTIFEPLPSVKFFNGLKNWV